VTVNLFLRRELHWNQIVFITVPVEQRSKTMKKSCLRASGIVLAFCGGMSLALAQTPPPDGSKGDQNGKQEPSAKNTGDTPAPAGVLVNGALAVPGAPTDTSTVPAKFSKKNDAADHLLLLGYTFKSLSDDQKRAIYQSVKGKADAAKVTGANPQIGDVVPETLALTPLPSEASAQAPDMQKYQYAMNGDKLLVINPVNMVVVEVIAAQ
jgi:hypothetical protein